MTLVYTTLSNILVTRGRMSHMTSLLSQSKSSLDIVPQTAYPQVQSPMSSPVQASGEWGILGNKNHQVIPGDVPTKIAEHDYMGGSSLSSRCWLSSRY